MSSIKPFVIAGSAAIAATAIGKVAWDSISQRRQLDAIDASDGDPHEGRKSSPFAAAVTRHELHAKAAFSMDDALLGGIGVLAGGIVGIVGRNSAPMRVAAGVLGGASLGYLGGTLGSQLLHDRTLAPTTGQLRDDLLTSYDASGDDKLQLGGSWGDQEYPRTRLSNHRELIGGGHTVWHHEKFEDAVDGNHDGSATSTEIESMLVERDANSDGRLSSGEVADLSRDLRLNYWRPSDTDW